MFGIDVWTILLTIVFLLMLGFVFTGRKSVIAWLIIGSLLSLTIILYDLVRGFSLNWMLCKQVITVLLFLGMIYEISGDLAGYKNEEEN